MNVFDIIGPVMIGPSSSHTAGAARIGKISRTLLGDEPACAHILFHGSFAKTYKGHGTDKAIVGGILGMLPDDERIRTSLELAPQLGLEVQFDTGEIDGAHPNTALVTLTGKNGGHVEVEGASVGGGNIIIHKINGTEVEFTGQNTTLIVSHQDIPGMIADVTNLLARRGVNICNFKLRRHEKGGIAVMVIETDDTVSDELNERIRRFPSIVESTLIRP